MRKCEEVWENPTYLISHRIRLLTFADLRNFYGNFRVNVLYYIRFVIDLSMRDFFVLFTVFLNGEMTPFERCILLEADLLQSRRRSSAQCVSYSLLVCCENDSVPFC